MGLRPGSTARAYRSNPACPQRGARRVSGLPPAASARNVSGLGPRTGGSDLQFRYSCARSDAVVEAGPSLKRAQAGSGFQGREAPSSNPLSSSTGIVLSFPERLSSIELSLPLPPLLLEQRGRRDAEVGRGTLSEAFIPFATIHLALKSGQCNVAERPVMLPRIAPKASMKRLGQVL